MAKELVYFKKNVNYNVGVRKFRHDADGVILTNAEPYVGVAVEDIKDFKQANKRVILEGLIVQSPEPSVDWETANAINDEEVAELVKNYLKLKSRLPNISSLPVLYKMQEEAKDQDRAKRIKSMIQARIDELEDEDTDTTEIARKEDMQGVS